MTTESLFENEENSADVLWKDAFSKVCFSKNSLTASILEVLSLIHISEKPEKCILWDEENAKEIILSAYHSKYTGINNGENSNSSWGLWLKTKFYGESKPPFKAFELKEGKEMEDLSDDVQLIQKDVAIEALAQLLPLLQQHKGPAMVMTLAESGEATFTKWLQQNESKKDSLLLSKLPLNHQKVLLCCAVELVPNVTIHPRGENKTDVVAIGASDNVLVDFTLFGLRENELRIQEMIDSWTKRENDAIQQAKTQNRAGNKNAAVKAFALVKNIRKRKAQQYGALTNIQQTIISFESSMFQSDYVQVLDEATVSLKALNQDITVEQVEATMTELQEHSEGHQVFDLPAIELEEEEEDLVKELEALDLRDLNDAMPAVEKRGPVAEAAKGSANNSKNDKVSTLA